MSNPEPVRLFLILLVLALFYSQMFRPRFLRRLWLGLGRLWKRKYRRVK